MDIAYKSETKFLSVHISEYMKWDARVRSLSYKLSKFCYMIESLKDVTSSHLVRSIYLAYLHTYVRYGVVFWRGDSKSKIIFKLQKWVIEMIEVSRCTSCEQLLRIKYPSSTLHVYV
jgi:mRNA deadenylase 3'-5' endonuclease subunit Ccr4